MTPGFTHVPHIKWCFVMLATDVWNLETCVCLDGNLEMRASIICPKKPRCPFASRPDAKHPRYGPMRGAQAESWGRILIRTWLRYLPRSSSMPAILLDESNCGAPQRPAIVQLRVPELHSRALCRSFENPAESPDAPARGAVIVNSASLVGLQWHI